MFVGFSLCNSCRQLFRSWRLTKRQTRRTWCSVGRGASISFRFRVASETRSMATGRQTPARPIETTRYNTLKLMFGVPPRRRHFAVAERLNCVIVMRFRMMRCSSRVLTADEIYVRWQSVRPKDGNFGKYLCQDVARRVLNIFCRNKWRTTGRRVCVKTPNATEKIAQLSFHTLTSSTTALLSGIVTSWEQPDLGA